MSVHVCVRVCLCVCYRFILVSVWSHDCSAVLLLPDKSRPPLPVYVKSSPLSYVHQSHSDHETTHRPTDRVCVHVCYRHSDRQSDITTVLRLSITQ